MAKHRAPDNCCTDDRCGPKKVYLCRACFYRLSWLWLA